MLSAALAQEGKAMKLSCGVYEDLLLLYNDGLCSEDTKKLVEEHLAGCEKCSRYLKNMRLPEELVKEEAATAEPKEDTRAEKEIIQKSFRKIRRRWAMSLLILPLLLVLAVPAFMIANEIRGEGICFSNLDDIWYCRQFIKLIADGEYEKAAGMLDFSGSYKHVKAVLSGELPGEVTEEQYEIFLEFYGDVLNMSEEEFVAQEQQKIADYLRENPPLIWGFHFDDAYRTDDRWVIGYEIVEGVQNPDKVGVGELKYSFYFVKFDKGLSHASSYIPMNWEDRLWELEEELALFGAFHVQGDHLSRRLRGLE